MNQIRSSFRFIYDLRPPRSDRINKLQISFTLDTAVSEMRNPLLKVPSVFSKPRTICESYWVRETRMFYLYFNLTYFYYYIYILFCYFLLISGRLVVGDG